MNKVPLVDFEEYWRQIPEHMLKVIKDAVKNHVDVSPMIIPAKDGQIMAYINPIGDRDQYLKIMAMIIQGMEPDEILFVTDAYVSSSEYKHDGTKWEHGEMEVAYMDMTVDHDLVSENVCVMRMDRLGNLQAISVDYRRKDDDTVEIDEPRTFGIDDQGEGMSGYIVDKLREFFAKETYRQWAIRNNVDFLPSEEMSESEFSAFMTSMIIKQALIPLGCSVMLMIQGKGNSEKIYEYFKDDEAEGQYRVMNQAEYEKWTGRDEDRE